VEELPVSVGLFSVRVVMSELELVDMAYKNMWILLWTSH
jgi:hypothetical protein